MTEKNNTPQIRFRGFSYKWTLCKVIDFAPLQRGFDLPRSKFVVGGYPVITSNGVNGFHSAYKAEGPGVVTGRSGTIGEVHYIDSRYWPHNTTLWVTNFKNNNHLYVYYVYTRFNLAYFATGSGVPTLNRNDIHDKVIFIAEFEEQKKIGEYFQQLDRLIEQKEKKYQKLQQFKKAMLGKMFPANDANAPSIRLTGFTDNWQEKSLSDFGMATSGTSIESEFKNNGIYNVISIGSYSENSTYVDQGLRANLSKKTENRILSKNDLTMVLNDKTASGNILGRVLLIEEGQKYVYNQRTQRIEPFQEQYNSQFLYQLLNAPLIRRLIINKSQGNTQIYVNWSTIRNLVYLVPKKEEQSKIGDFFQKLDQLIGLQQQELQKLKNLKKAFLAKMFV
ncbi:MAG: restriction endonuclease subunit S [Neisseriales bacterium]|nr:MAG: restriction endonuclease subunit S [Neisseriales bacterium]